MMPWQTRYNYNPSITPLGSIGESKNTPLWEPHSENIPQQIAFNSTATLIGYGGAVGGGKTDLALGLAIEKHRDSIIFRREYPQTVELVQRSAEILETHARWNGSDRRWRWDGKTLAIGAMQHEHDKQKQRGRPRDLMVFDEATEFLETQFEFVVGWLRSTKPDQHCQILLTFNPPESAQGQWVVDLFEPWLNGEVESGEVLWFIRPGELYERVGSGEPIDIDGETWYPQSRTFIRARLEDNRYLYENNDYERNLQMLSPVQRQRLRHGDMSVSDGDHPFQVIPTEWILSAMNRWERTPKPVMECTALGVDVARGGKNDTVIAKRWGNWYDRLIKVPGRDTPNGNAVVTLIYDNWEDGAIINIDPLAVGTSPYDQLVDDDKPVVGIDFGAGSEYVDTSGRYRMYNYRAEVYWRFREMLHPEFGDNICLPNDKRLLQQLRSIRYEQRGGKVIIESKKDIAKRLGGDSTDDADAIVICSVSGGQMPEAW